MFCFCCSSILVPSDTKQSRFFIPLGFSTFKSGSCCRFASASRRPPGWHKRRPPSVSSVHLHPQLDSFPSHLHKPHPQSPAHPRHRHRCLPAAGAIYRPCFISTPAGRQSCHSGPTEPLRSSAWEWKCTLLMQELIFVALSLQTHMILFCCACAERCSAACGEKIKKEWCEFI